MTLSPDQIADCPMCGFPKMFPGHKTMERFGFTIEVCPLMPPDEARVGNLRVVNLETEKRS